ncbi:MAG: hypothetical protein H2036_01230, partial [Acidimicrobiales bacterium]|nr:hypothetical protein [Acidimicrobiales bacterium]
DPDEEAPECITDPDCDDDGILDPDEEAPECITDPDCDDDGILDPDEEAPECITDPDSACGITPTEPESPKEPEAEDAKEIEDGEEKVPSAVQELSDDPFPWWIVLLMVLAVLALMRIWLLVYMKRRSPIITHIAISELTEPTQFEERDEMSSLVDFEVNPGIEYLSDDPDLTEVKFTIRINDGKLEHGSSSSSYTLDPDLPSHDLQLETLPSVVSINGIVSEIIWAIKAKRAMGTTFTIEFEVDGEWVKISDIASEVNTEGKALNIYPYCRLVAKFPFGMKRFSPPAPLGLISLEGTDQPTS